MGIGRRRIAVGFWVSISSNPVINRFFQYIFVGNRRNEEECSVSVYLNNLGNSF